MPKRKLGVHLETLETGGGNTISPPVRIIPSKKWCFTYNNYPLEMLETLETVFQSFDIEYIFGQEIGENGTPHLQGYIESPIKIRPIEKLKLPKDIHWEKAKGNRLANVKYCSKDGKYVHTKTLKPPRQIELCEPSGWQLDVLNIVNTEPDKRSIYWFWEAVGGVGKTELCRYLVMKHDALVLGGKAADIRNGVVEYKKANGTTPDLVIVNYARSQEAFISYEGLENIKDMLFYSGKYEGGMICGPQPHLIVFANFAPDIDKLSNDRWKVHEISTDQALHTHTPQGGGVPPPRPPALK